MTSLRCSSLPRIVACAAASEPPAVRIEGDHAPASLGTAFHSCMASVAKGDDYDVQATAAEHNVSPKDLAPLVGWAAHLWRERLAPLFPAPRVEEGYLIDEGDGLTLTGTLDLLSVADDEVRVLDWKSGWSDTDATEQLKGYGFLAWRHTLNPSIKRVRLTKLQVRRQTADTTVWEVAELEAWWQWLKRHVRDTQTFRPSPHCGRCPRALECPAHLQTVKAFALAIVGEQINISATYPGTLVNALLYSRLIGRMVERFQEQLKAHVEANGGTLGRLALAERTTRTIDAARGWDVLTEAVGTDALMPALRVTKEKLEDAIKANAPYRGKGAAVKDFYARLETVGALIESTNHHLEINHNGDSSTGTKQLAATNDGGNRAQD